MVFRSTCFHWFSQVEADPQLYFWPSTGAMLSVFADDLMLTGPPNQLPQLQRLIESKMKMKWPNQITAGSWVKYLGHECQMAPNGSSYIERVPPDYLKQSFRELQMSRIRTSWAPIVKLPSVLRPEEQQPLTESNHTV